MSGTYTLSAAVLALDGLSQSTPIPVVTPTAGEGLQGVQKAQNDTVHVTTGALQFDFFRLCRFPTNVKIKHVLAYAKGIDSNGTAAGAFDVNVGFSDSISDGTPVSAQAAIPTNALDGTLATYVNGVGYTGTPNRMFGSGVVLNNNSGAAKYTELTYINTFTPPMTLIPLWKNFGFKSATGLDQDPGGLFDILLMMSTVASTPAAGDIVIEVDFVL